MTPRSKDVIGGSIILLISAGLYFYNWRLILSRSEYYPKAMFFGAAMMIIGLGLIIFGGYRTERVNKGEDVSQLSGLKLLTTKWWMILVAAVIFGIANWIYVEFLH